MSNENNSIDVGLLDFEEAFADVVATNRTFR